MSPVPAPSADRLASTALAAEVSKKVRELGLFMWLDADAHYTALVESLAAGAFSFEYTVVRFRGSHLELMLALEPDGNGLQPEHVLVHLPGLNKDAVKRPPRTSCSRQARCSRRTSAPSCARPRSASRRRTRSTASCEATA